MNPKPKVLAPRPRPTKNAYKRAVAKMIRHLKAEHDLTNDELGDRVGCSGPTIGNAENERNELSGSILVAIQHEFGADAIDHVQDMAGARGVPQGATCDIDLNTIARLAEAIMKLSAAKDPNSESGTATGPKEAAELLPILRAARSELDHEIARITPLSLVA